MKKTVSYFLLLSLLVLSFCSCQKMDDTYRKFIVEGGLVYPGIAVDPVSHSGHNRVLLSWKKGTDPSVVKALIFWNNFTDSTSIDIPAGMDSINAYIDGLAEQQYTFQIVTLNDRGDRSVPTEVLGNVYGDLYIASLLNRPIIQAFFDGEGSVKMNWGVADFTNGAIGMEVKYTDLSGQEKLVYFPVEDQSSSLSDIDGDSFDFRTVFLPDSLAIDTFYTAFETFKQEIREGGRSYLVDFAPAGNTAYNQPTLSPDVNGHYWNNYTGNNANSSMLLVDVNNEYGGISLTTVASFAVNTGASLGTQVTDAAGLGDLSIPTATMDCFYVENNTGRLKFTGLNPSQGYVLSLYGGRVASDLRETEYTVTGATTLKNIHQTSGQPGTGVNTNKLFVTPVIYPTLEGEIEIAVKNQTSVFGYINALKLEEK